MAVSINDSVGYEGTVEEPDWARLMAYAGGRQYGVIGESDWKVTAGTADREVRIAPGSGFGYGVLDRTTATASIVLPAPASGSRWHLIAVRRDWQNNLSTLDSIPGPTGTAALPARSTTPGTADDQPIALVRVQAGQSQVAEIRDLRVWGGDGGSYASDDLVRQYLTRLGTILRIGDIEWTRGLDALGSAVWRSRDVTPDTGWINIIPTGTGFQPFGTGIKFRRIGRTVFFNLSASSASWGRAPDGDGWSVAPIPAGMEPDVTLSFTSSYDDVAKEVQFRPAGNVVVAKPGSGGLTVAGSYPAKA